jgi:hypothetical protein
LCLSRGCRDWSRRFAPPPAPSSSSSAASHRELTAVTAVAHFSFAVLLDRVFALNLVRFV